MAAKFDNSGPDNPRRGNTGGGGWRVFWADFDTSIHLETVKAGVLYRDGVRGLIRLSWRAARSMRSPWFHWWMIAKNLQPPFTDEMAYCQANGIEVIRLPITLGGWPHGDQISRFLAIAADPARQPVLVHCAQGVRRTGMMVAAYQLSVLKLDKQQAFAAIKSFGHSRRTVNDVERFIEVYVPKAEQMTADMPPSSE